MAYDPTIWTNREVERPRTFTLQNNPDGTVTLIPAEGKVNEPGTPIMAANMNKIEDELVKSDQHINNQQIHVTQAKQDKWDKAFSNTHRSFTVPIVDGRPTTEGIQALNPAQLRTKMSEYLPDGMGELKFFVEQSQFGLYVDTHGVMTIQIPWVDSSGGRIVQIIEGENATFKRFALDETTWGRWINIQHSTVDVGQLFQSVSNGKAVVNQAVTDMGVYTAPDAPFATTAANIRNLNSIVSGIGTVTSNSSQTFFNVSGLSFRPRAFMFRARGGNIPGSWGVYNGTWAANEFVVVIGNNSMGNASSVFQGGFNVAAAYPGGTGQFDWWTIK